MVKVVLVGAPNVGKSVIFNYLTGKYVAVSNYPGTTVDIIRGYSESSGKKYEIIDTPGMYSMIPITEEERVTRQLLCREKGDIVLHIIDGKNISRMLMMTLQLMDAGFPVILIVNFMDEAFEYGVVINIPLLAEILGIVVIPTSATKGTGLDDLKDAINRYKRPKKNFRMEFSDDIEKGIVNIASKVVGNYGISPRMVALLMVQKDRDIYESAYQQESMPEIVKVIKEVSAYYEYSMEYIVALQGQKIVDGICNKVLRTRSACQQKWVNRVGRLTCEPISGIFILCCVLYFGVYEFVGKFGAGVVVDYIDVHIFSAYIIPTIEYSVGQFIPWEWLQSLILGKYGIFTMGFRYAFVIILPIVGTFFLMFAFLEDSGYLPRMAMLVDKIFKYLGLNGRAVIPFVLGVGCGTMAVMVTRTLETRRERILATFLLSSTIPCSAQLGIILALLSSSPMSIVIWSTYLGMIFLTIGWLSGKIMPGQSSNFFMEIPPLRIPQLLNVFSKACFRMWWYFVEILPIFVVTSIVLWCSDESGLLSSIIIAAQPIMEFLGLPRETAQAFLVGFFRRDYGAAGLYELCASHNLTQEQLLIGSVTLTLFVPCIAQVAVMIKERGILLTITMVFIIMWMAIFFGGALHYFLNFWRIYI